LKCPVIKNHSVFNHLIHQNSRKSAGQCKKNIFVSQNNAVSVNVNT